MAVAAIMPPSMPSSKKRCWNLLVKDVRNNGEQDDPTLVCGTRHGMYVFVSGMALETWKAQQPSPRTPRDVKIRCSSGKKKWSVPPCWENTLMHLAKTPRYLGSRNYFLRTTHPQQELFGISSAVFRGSKRTR